MAAQGLPLLGIGGLGGLLEAGREEVVTAEDRGFVCGGVEEVREVLVGTVYLILVVEAGRVVGLS